MLTKHSLFPDFGFLISYFVILFFKSKISNKE
jgi:hypothetical protein